VDDAHRQRDLVLLCASGLALAIPALGDVAEQGADGPWNPEPVGQHLCHFAEGREMFFEHERDPRKAEGKLTRAHEWRVSWRGDRAQEAGDHLSPRPESDRGRVRRQSVIGAEELGGDVGVGRAADVEQQARVVRLRRRLRIDAQTIGKPHCNKRALQPVLERNSDAEVRRQ
jgi:hypothetical protein